MDSTSVLLVDFYIGADVRFLSEKQFILILQLNKDNTRPIRSSEIETGELTELCRDFHQNWQHK